MNKPRPVEKTEPRPRPVLTGQIQDKIYDLRTALEALFDVTDGLSVAEDREDLAPRAVFGLRMLTEVVRDQVRELHEIVKDAWEGGRDGKA